MMYFVHAVFHAILETYTYMYDIVIHVHVHVYTYIKCMHKLKHIRRYCRYV